MNKLNQTKIFSIQNKHARHLLAITIAYIPSISNSAAALFSPCIMTAYFTQIGYMFLPIDMTFMPSSRSKLSNIIEESSVTSMLDMG